jgi:hypothetical protein
MLDPCTWFHSGHNLQQNFHTVLCIEYTLITQSRFYYQTTYIFSQYSYWYFPCLLSCKIQQHITEKIYTYSLVYTCKVNVSLWQVRGDHNVSVRLKITIQKLKVTLKVSLTSLQGQRDTGLTLTPSVIPNYNYAVMVSDWNFKIFLCVFYTVIFRCKRLLDYPV